MLYLQLNQREASRDRLVRPVVAVYTTPALNHQFKFCIYSFQHLWFIFYHIRVATLQVFQYNSDETILLVFINGVMATAQIPPPPSEEIT